jgi:hypothetical protein
MRGKRDLQEWIVEALQAKGGAATQLEVAKFIWEHHSDELQAADDLFYTWQYDYRWEAQKLRDQGVLKPKYGQRGGSWELA